MIVLEPKIPTLIGYPAAPTNGGRLDETTPLKIGLWGWEPKIDDWRGVIHVPTRTVWNQYGQRSTIAEQDKIGVTLDHLQRLAFAVEWLDVGLMENRNDMMRGCIIVFDMIRSPSGNDDWPLLERRQHLEAMFPTLPPATTLLESGTVHDHVYLIQQWRNVIQPQMLNPLRLEASLLLQNAAIGRKFYEGLVAKRLDSNYPLGLRPKTKTPAWIKHRFDQ